MMTPTTSAVGGDKHFRCVTEPLNRRNTGLTHATGRLRFSAGGNNHRSSRSGEPRCRGQCRDRLLQHCVPFEILRGTKDTYNHNPELRFVSNHRQAAERPAGNPGAGSERYGRLGSPGASVRPHAAGQPIWEPVRITTKFSAGKRAQVLPTG
jgi:hypothetical protein